jgi:hypothetical protein
LFLFQANLEVIFPPEIQGMGEFKAGPGDVARLEVKVKSLLVSLILKIILLKLMKPRLYIKLGRCCQ